nr:hypothetical protein [uncultured bacterium]
MHTNTGLSPTMAQLSSCLLFRIYIRWRGPTTPNMPKHIWFGLFPVRSPLLGESLIIFFSSSYLDVSVHWVSSFR